MSGTFADAEQTAGMIQMALAEAGYPNAIVNVTRTKNGRFGVAQPRDHVPAEAWYRAGVLTFMATGRRFACFDCWLSCRGGDVKVLNACADGDCPHRRLET